MLLPLCLAWATGAKAASGADATACSPTTSNYPKLKLNEVKTQGSAGTTFIELFVDANGTSKRRRCPGYGRSFGLRNKGGRLRQVDGQEFLGNRFQFILVDVKTRRFFFCPYFRLLPVIIPRFLC